MSSLRSIALYGPSGSGKSELARHLADHYGYAIAKPGLICREITRLLFGTEAKTALNTVNDALKAIDPLIWTKAALAKIPSGAPLVFDGMRVRDEYELFRSRGFWLWKISANLPARLRRLSGRGQTFNPQVDNLHPEEYGLFSMPFDVEINNDGNLDNLYAAVEHAMAGCQ